MSPIRLPVKKLIFSIIPILVISSTLEIVARIYCYARFEPYSTNILIQGNGRMSSEPMAVWGNSPHYLEYDLTAQYNDLGIRVNPGDDLTMASSTGDDFLVLLLGGSAMAGMGTVHKGEWMKITGISTGGREQSIDGFLELMLQEAMPQRTVRVANAAVNCSTLVQSQLHFQRLKHLNPDWVISMDGFNDPSWLAPEQTSMEFVQDFWKSFHYFRFPYNMARFAMSQSAFFYLVGETLFYELGIISNTHMTHRDEQVLEHWLSSIPPPPSPVRPDDGRSRAVDEYFRIAEAFHREMKSDGQKHLLLVQPEVTARQAALLGPVEKAVYNYTLHATNGPNQFLADLHARARRLHVRVPELVSMAAVDSWDTWVFLDYCHLTKEANQRIAREICDHILSDGKNELFSSPTGA